MDLLTRPGDRRSSSGSTGEEREPRARRSPRQYLYGILRATPEAMDLGPIGLGGETVRIVDSGSLAALVSDYRGPTPLVASRRNLRPHHEVLSAVSRDRTVLPLRFGHVVPGAGSVTRFLARHRRELEETLARVDGCVELGLRVSWQTGTPFDHVLARDPELVRLRDRLFRPGESPGREELIALGREFAMSLGRERQRLEQVIRRALDGTFSESEDRPPAREAVLVDLALLVPRDRRPALEERIEDVARTLGDELLVEISGPFPPHSFTRLTTEG